TGQQPTSGQPYGQQPDPYAQPPQAPQYGQQPTSGQPYGQQPDPYAQPPQAPQYGQQPTSGQPYGQPTSGQPYQDPYAQQQPYGAAPTYPAAGYPQPQGQGQNNNLGLIGMIAGIASIVLGLCCPLLGIPAGIAGVVLGVMGQKKAQQGLATNAGQAKAGLICGGIGVVIGIINAIAGAAINLSNLGS
ncbi:DUF4190 domain-containing protein, partial [Micromonospora sp. NPDC047738]|uniref:DUF4190 domain-containing protein n=1 Tax=Micromonospora sp. NPDC047738 TaxID=3155741 RepID=UPI0033C739A7